MARQIGESINLLQFHNLTSSKWIIHNAIAAVLWFLIGTFVYRALENPIKERVKK